MDERREGVVLARVEPPGHGGAAERLDLGDDGASLVLVGAAGDDEVDAVGREGQASSRPRPRLAPVTRAMRGPVAEVVPGVVVDLAVVGVVVVVISVMSPPCVRRAAG